MPAVHLLTSDPSGHAGKSLPELTDGQTQVMVKLKYLRGSHDDSWFKPVRKGDSMSPTLLPLAEDTMDYLLSKERR